MTITQIIIILLLSALPIISTIENWLRSTERIGQSEANDLKMFFILLCQITIVLLLFLTLHDKKKLEKGCPSYEKIEETVYRLK